jgi:DHA1 family multidrug resistance protein-like MFS transporter
MNQRNYRNVLAISLSQLGLAFSFNFVLVFLPFFTHTITSYSSKSTLIWLGFIMGAPSFAAAVSSSYWGSMASRISPKLLFMGGLLSHAVTILLMAYVANLPVLLFLRIVQGLLGGISTVGLILISSSTSKEKVSRDLGLYQNSMTLGQLIGPPAGALAATMLGYKGAFISASILVFATMAFSYCYVMDLPPASRKLPSKKKHTMNLKILFAWGLCFTTNVQLMFLPSVLPNVFDGFNLAESTAVKSAGMVVMLSTATAMAGTYLLSRLAEHFASYKLVIVAAVVGAVLQFFLAICPGIVSFVLVRMLQTAMVAAVMPLVFSSFASNLNERMIGFLNSSRFAGNALGPMIATSVLAFSNLNWLYLSVGGLGFLAVVGYTFAGDTETL